MDWFWAQPHLDLNSLIEVLIAVVMASTWLITRSLAALGDVIVEATRWLRPPNDGEG